MAYFSWSPDFKPSYVDPAEEQRRKEALEARRQLEEKSQGVLSIGKHCTYPSCRREDYLPSDCDKCQRTFCADHFKYEDHECYFKIEYENTMPKCPICDQYVRVPLDGVPDAIVNAHILSGCKSHLLDDKEQRQRIKQALRCDVPTCGNPNKYSTLVCPKCQKQVCLTHRFPTDHACPSLNPAPASAPSAAVSTALSKLRSLFASRPSEKKTDTAIAATATTSAANTATGNTTTTATAATTTTATATATSAAKSEVKSSNSAPAAVSTSGGVTYCAPPVQNRVRVTPVELSKLRRNAEPVQKPNTADDELEFSQRIYFNIVFPARDPSERLLPASVRNQQPQRLYFNKKHTVGKAIDLLCAKYGIANNNADPKKPKITLARIDEPALSLPFSSTFETLVKDRTQFDLVEGETLGVVWVTVPSA